MHLYLPEDYKNKLISSRNQLGYIKGRYIGNNIRLILNIFEDYENTNKKILYNKPNLCIKKKNDWISKKCKMYRWIRQGYPLSAIPFFCKGNPQ